MFVIPFSSTEYIPNLLFFIQHILTGTNIYVVSSFLDTVGRSRELSQ